VLLKPRPKLLLLVVLCLAAACYGLTAGDIEAEATDGPTDAEEHADEQGDEAADYSDETEDIDDEDVSTDVVDDGPSDEAHADGGPCPEGMVFVPAGEFVMGSDPDEGHARERPEHTVTLSAYCIDSTEVTRREYVRCVEDGACVYDATQVQPEPDMPAWRLTWTQSETLCAWGAKRLPTEAEWEKAARGGCDVVAPSTCGPEDERRYPWGDEPEPTPETANLCYRGDGLCGFYAELDVVGTRAADVSPYGAHDMLGNVAEWVADWFGADAYESCVEGCVDPSGPASGEERTLRGGSVELPADRSSVAVRGGIPPDDDPHGFVGVRCAYTP
jgi:formylglycine-generating enzyme required for sulfatase activity